jgi:hypothetical protein
MRKLGISFVLGLVAVVLAVQTAAQSAVPVTLIKAGRLLDPRTGNILAPAGVLIESGKIKQVGPPSQVQVGAPAGIKIIDLGSATLLPGEAASSDPQAKDGLGNCLRVDRGSSWMFPAWLLRSATRERNPADYRDVLMGFRVARTLP